MSRMALILAILLSAAPVTAADAPKASGAAVTTTAVAVAAAETPKIEPSDSFWEYWGHGKGATRSEIFRNFGLALIAFVGLCFGIWRAWTAHRQAIVAEQGLITDRFSTAVDQLGNNQLPVRLGGIYALWRLTEDAPERDVVRVVDILCAFVRSPPPESSGLRDPGPNNAGTDPEEGASVATTLLRPDVQTILDLIAQRSAKYRRRLTTGYILDLQRANLARASLGGANLKGANLAGADFAGAELAGANLAGANLIFANLPGANLAGADLAGAYLWSAKLAGANLMYANLAGADLRDTDLSDANLRDSVGLSQPQLDSACVAKGGHPPTLPEGLNPPTNVCPED